MPTALDSRANSSMYQVIDSSPGAGEGDPAAPYAVLVEIRGVLRIKGYNVPPTTVEDWRNRQVKRNDGEGVALQQHPVLALSQRHDGVPPNLTADVSAANISEADMQEILRLNPELASRLEKKHQHQNSSTPRLTMGG